MHVDTNKCYKILVPVDLDEGAVEGFFGELEIVLEDRPEEVLIDCSHLDHATSGHINLLWEAQTKCDESGSAMRLVSVRYGLERVLRVLDLYDLFTIGHDHVEVGAEADETGQGGVSLELEFKASMPDINDALSRFHDFLVRLGVPGTVAFDLEIVFYEVATNIRRHSGLTETDVIAFSATPEQEKISLRFADSGEPFDPTSATIDFDPRKAIKSKQINGIGLTMIQRLVDSITYRRVGNSLNVVTLTKHLRQGGKRGVQD